MFGDVISVNCNICCFFVHVRIVEQLLYLNHWCPCHCVFATVVSMAAIVQQIFYYLLGKGGYVFGSVGLSVCLFVCLFVCLWTTLLKKL